MRPRTGHMLGRTHRRRRCPPRPVPALTHQPVREHHHTRDQHSRLRRHPRRHHVHTQQMVHDPHIPTPQVRPQWATQPAVLPQLTGHVQRQIPAVMATGDLRHPHTGTRIARHLKAQLRQHRQQRHHRRPTVRHPHPPAHISPQRLPHTRPRHRLTRLKSTRFPDVMTGRTKRHQPGRLLQRHPQPISNDLPLPRC
ncbi:hypothetical protein SCOCK_140030 [Actinacidiphila cocklensis]|uniref:Uncharacterized protein n=1 Tax=Actinacidiphila cocklensis TaxID=887465 RepID=A0A9W4E348_9ACTN|nr:hypothetical protein SCOCK_140030 [Actinacidiphila cocklensis]